MQHETRIPGRPIGNKEHLGIRALQKPTQRRLVRCRLLRRASTDMATRLLPHAFSDRADRLRFEEEQAMIREQSEARAAAKAAAETGTAKKASA